MLGNRFRRLAATSFMQGPIRGFSSQLKEFVVCSFDELQESRFKTVTIGSNQGNNIVISKIKNSVVALGGNCSHWGIPLGAGYIDGAIAYCPAHCAGFDVFTGEPVNNPAFFKIPSYEAYVNSEQKVVVKVPTQHVDNLAREEESTYYAKRDPNDKRTYVIVGGGSAGKSCAETLRRFGFTGRVVILSKSNSLPSDLPMMSKGFVVGQSFDLAPQSYYLDRDIELFLDSEVIAIDFNNKFVRLRQDNKSLAYDKLCITSGSTARIPRPFQSIVKKANVHSIRTAEDNQNISQQLSNAQNIVIIGGSFLGAESANSIKKSWPNKNVTIIDTEKLPLSRPLGTDIAQSLIDAQQRAGVIYYTGVTPTINTIGDHVSSITIQNHGEIPADILLLATGATMSTQFIPADILLEDQSVKVDAYLQTEVQDVFAAGDIATFYSHITETSQRIEHWAVAQNQGAVAAKNMLGFGETYSEAPFFWSNQAANVGFVGIGIGADSNWSEKGEDYIINYFFKANKCIGAAIFGKFGANPVLKAALERNLIPSLNEIKNVRYDGIFERLQQAQSNLRNAHHGTVESLDPMKCSNCIGDPKLLRHSKVKF